MRRAFRILLLILFSIMAKAQEISKINIKIEIERALLNTLMDEEIPKEISDEGTAGKGILADAIEWKYNVSRGDIEYSVYEGDVVAKAPLKGEAIASIKAFNKDFALNLSGTGGIKSNITLTNDWKIKARSTPILELNKIDLPVDIPLKKVMDEAVKDLDEKLGKIDLKEFFEKVWKELEKPLLIDEEKNSWLSIKPVTIKYSELSSSYESIQIYLMVDAYVETFIGSKPENIRLEPLPQIEKAEAEKRFVVNMPITAKYEELESIAGRETEGKIYPVYLGSSFAVEHIKIRGEGQKMEVNFDFTSRLLWGLLTTEGKISIIGIPLVEENESRVIFRELNYKLESDSFILEAVNRILGSGIRKKMNSYLQQGISELILTTQKDINKKIGEIKINEDEAVFNANLETLRIEGVSTSSEEITIDTYFEGEARIKIKKLKF